MANNESMMKRATGRFIYGNTFRRMLVGDETSGAMLSCIFF
jgi:hypothetical protein